jgi:hypothetical protein
VLDLSGGRDKIVAVERDWPSRRGASPIHSFGVIIMAISKATIREELEAALASFDGVVIVCPPMPNGKRVVKAKNSRKRFKSSIEPGIRPRQVWDSILVPHESRLYKGYAKEKGIA